MVETNWNSHTDGDYTGVDFTKVPWVSGVMTISHDDVVWVKEEIEKIVENYDPSTNDYQPISDMYIVARYCELTAYEKGINGETYDVIKTYNPEVNTQGINEHGIIPEPVEETEGE